MTSQWLQAILEACGTILPGRHTYWLNWLDKEPFTTLFVDGNHENIARLNALPVHQWHGGKVHFIRHMCFT